MYFDDNLIKRKKSIISTCGSHCCHHHWHNHYNLRDQHTQHHIHHHHDHHHLVGGRGGTSSEADDQGSPVEDNILDLVKKRKWTALPSHSLEIWWEQMGNTVEFNKFPHFTVSHPKGHYQRIHIHHITITINASPDVAGLISSKTRQTQWRRPWEENWWWLWRKLNIIPSVQHWDNHLHAWRSPPIADNVELRHGFGVGKS